MAQMKTTDLGLPNSIESIHKDSVSKVEIQKLWEHTFSKRQIRQLLRDEFKELFEPDEEHLNIKLDIMGIVSERNHVFFDTIIEMLIEKSNIKESKQVIADVLLELCERNYIDLETVRNNQKIWRNYVVSPETQEKIEGLKSLPPMIVEPLPVNHKGNNRGSGYLTIGSDSLILNDNHHEGDLCTDVLDKYNCIPLSINTDIVQTIRNCWGTLFDEETNKLTEEYKIKLASFEEFEKYSIKFMAMLVNQDNKFWLTHKYDKRGRIYSVGYWVNDQGNSYQKACVEFYNKELVTQDINFF